MKGETNLQSLTGTTTVESGRLHTEMKVLIVDDEPSVLHLLSAMVALNGFTVVEARDGEEAWDLLQAESYPIVITDWLMPNMDGMELIRAIRARENQLYSYIIMLTGASEADAFSCGMEAGADDLLTKPWRTEELLGRLNVAQRIMRLQQELAETNRTLRHYNRELEFFRNRVQRELEAAARVQESLLPGTLTHLPGVKVGWKLLPCEELAGDVLNIFPLDENHIGLYVLDVSGHGVSAAMLSVQLCRLLTSEMTQSQLLKRPSNGASRYRLQEPRVVMQELNQLFQKGLSRPQFFTLLYGILDIQEQQFQFSSAGHPGPIHISGRDGSRVVDASGTPIGMLTDGSWDDIVVPVSSGDRLALFSDGLIETMNPHGEMFGDHRIIDIVDAARDRPVADCCGAIMDSVAAWCGSRRLQDDCSLLMVELD